MTQNRLQKFAATLAAATTLLMASTTAFAQTNTPEAPRANKMERHAGAGHINRMFDKINATAEQRQKITAIMSAARPDMQKQRKDTMATQRSLQDAFTAPTLDKALIQQLSAQRDAAHAAGAKRMTQTLIEVAEILTPDQRQQLHGHLGMMLMGPGPMAARAHGGRHWDKNPSQAAPKSPGE